MYSWTNIQGGNPVGFTTYSYYNKCPPMQRPPGKRSVTMLFDKAANSLHPSEMWVWVSLLTLWASRPPRKKFNGHTTKYTNWKDCLEQNHAMSRWQKTSTRKYSTPSRSASIAGGVPPSWQRNQAIDPSTLPGHPHSLSFSGKSMWHTTTSGTWGRGPASRP